MPYLRRADDCNMYYEIDDWSDPWAHAEPVLFIHGDDDRNVKVAQTIDLARRLDTTTVDHSTLLLPDETHSILRYANVLTMNRAVAEFLISRLGAH